MGNSRFDEQNLLFESVLCGIIRYDIDGNHDILEYNSASAKIFGCGTKENFADFMAKSDIHDLSGLVYPYDIEIVRGFIRRCLKNGQSVNFGHRILKKDQTIGYIIGTLNVVQLPDGRRVLQSIFQDSGHRVVQADIRKSIFYKPILSRNNRKKVIAASENPELISEFRHMLKADYDLIEARTDQEVLSVLGKEKDDIAAVLTDTAIATREDYRFMATLKSSMLYGTLPIVVFSDGGTEREEEVLSYGANDFIARPYKSNVVRLRLSNLIELRDTAIQRNAVEKIVDNLPGGILILKFGEKIETLFVSDGIYHLGGKDKNDQKAIWKGDIIEKHVLKADKQRVFASVNEAVKSGKPIEFTCRILHADGTPVWIHVHGVKIREEDGYPVYQAIASPTTAAEKMYQDMLDNSFSAIFVTDDITGELLYINNAGGKLLQEIPNLSYKMEGISSSDYLIQQIIPEGTDRHIVLSGKVIDWNGIPAHVTYMTDDTATYREQAEMLEKALHEAEQANSAKGMFLSRMSHEIRTPLNAILGMSSLALDEVENRQSTMDYLSKINASGEYLLGLINDILDMSKIESDRVHLDPEPYSIKECIDFVMISMCTQMQLKNIEFAYQEEGVTGEEVMLDKMRIRQVFFNLLSNAVKFTNDGGRIEVKVTQLERRNGAVRERIIVKDNGIGIAEDAQGLIFEPFEQVKQKNDASSQGTGLGLAIVKNLLRMMHGEISVRSRVGQGTEFIVELTMPIAGNQGNTGAEASQVPDEYDFAGKKILLAEDHPINMEIATKLLMRKKCQVVCAENGQVAVNILGNSRPYEYDLVLMDIRMPILDGIEATRIIRMMEREDMKTIPIIAMTANAFDEDAKETKLAGMDAHFPKPIETDKFYRTLYGFLREKRG